MFGTVIGGMLLEMIKPAKMLPIKRRLIELISRGLFSLIRTRDLETGKCYAKMHVGICRGGNPQP